MRYKTALLEQTYTKALAAASSRSRDLFTPDGLQRRGSSQACAFWDGYNGVRSPVNVPGLMSAACYQAGKHFAKSNRGIQPQPKGRTIT